MRKYFKPKSPIGRTADVASGAALVKELLRAPGASCPMCKEGELHNVLNHPDQRKCDRCDEIITIHEVSTRFQDTVTYSPSVKASELRKSGTYTLYLLCGLIIASSLFAVLFDSWITLLGALIASVPIFSYAMLMRYRAWQVENNQLFKLHAPVGRFLRAELRNLVGAPDEPMIEILSPDTFSDNNVEQNNDNKRN